MRVPFDLTLQALVFVLKNVSKLLVRRMDYEGESGPEEEQGNQYGGCEKCSHTNLGTGAGTTCGVDLRD